MAENSARIRGIKIYRIVCRADLQDFCLFYSLPPRPREVRVAVAFINGLDCHNLSRKDRFQLDNFLKLASVSSRPRSLMHRCNNHSSSQPTII